MEGSVEMECIGNLLESMMVFLVSTPSNWEYRFSTAISCRQVRLPVEGLGYGCWPRRSHGTPKQPRLTLKELVALH